MVTRLLKPVRKYTDIAQNFGRHPITGSLSLKNNVEAIKQSVRNILLTRRGEKLFDPNFGSPVYEYLFENMSPVLVTIIQESIINVLGTYEPRVEVTEVLVEYDNQHQLLIDVRGRIRATSEPFTVQTFFERLR